MPMASNTGTYDVVRIPEARPHRRLRIRPVDLAESRDALVIAQVLGVLGRASPPPEVSWRQVARRLLFFTIALSLLLFGGTAFGGS